MGVDCGGTVAHPAWCPKPSLGRYLNAVGLPAANCQPDPMFDGLDHVELLRHEHSWHTAIGELRELWAAHGDEARTRVAEVQKRYVDRRAAMIVDAVMSVQQDYERKVLPLVARFEETPAAASLEALSELNGVDQTLFNNSPKRTATIVGVAQGLLRYGRERRLDEEQAVPSWARVTDGLEFAHDSEPYVGRVQGIGLALMGYLRLLGGADSIKVDDRVIRRLRQLGFDLGEPPQSRRGLMTCVLAAQEVGMRLGELDQLLWWQVPG